LGTEDLPAPSGLERAGTPLACARVALTYWQAPASTASVAGALLTGLGTESPNTAHAAMNYCAAAFSAFLGSLQRLGTTTPPRVGPPAAVTRAVRLRLAAANAWLKRDIASQTFLHLSSPRNAERPTPGRRGPFLVPPAKRNRRYVLGLSECRKCRTCVQL
jgi:hypothetical protein